MALGESDVDADKPFSTTTELTSSWAAGLSTAFGLAEPNRFIEILIRAVRAVHHWHITFLRRQGSLQPTWTLICFLNRIGLLPA